MRGGLPYLTVYCFFLFDHSGLEVGSILKRKQNGSGSGERGDGRELRRVGEMKSEERFTV